MDTAYLTGNQNMNVEMCILGCKLANRAYAGLKYG